MFIDSYYIMEQLDILLCTWGNTSGFTKSYTHDRYMIDRTVYLNGRSTGYSVLVFRTVPYYIPFNWGGYLVTIGCKSYERN